MKTVNRWRYKTGAFLLLAGALLLNSCGPKSGKKQQAQETQEAYYTCPMHHQIHEEKPGYCPICGMKLIKVSSSPETGAIPLDSALSYLADPVTQTVVGSYKVIQPVMTKSRDTVTVDGYIGFDQRDVNAVSTRVGGRIEKMYVRYVNQRVHKGEPLMTLYSPELVTAQRNLLQVLQDKDQELVRAMQQQLLNLGMRPGEIQQMMQSGKPLSVITIYSPYTGITRQAAAASANRMRAGTETDAGNMSGSPAMDEEQSAGQPEILDIREGMYVKEGQTLLSIANTGRVWAELAVFTSDVGQIHPGDHVRIYRDGDPADVIEGRIGLIPPYRQAGEKTTAVRIYLKQLPADWKINTLIHAQIMVSGRERKMNVPLSAVNRLGMENVVWVQDINHPNVFHARQVETGIQTKDSIQITDGLHRGDKIAENAAYMVAHESFVR